MPENIAGYKAAEKYASQVRQDEKTMEGVRAGVYPAGKSAEIKRLTGGRTWNQLRPGEQLQVKQHLNIPSKRKIPPEAKEFLAHTRFDPKTQKKAHGGYIKKYAKGGGVRKAR